MAIADILAEKEELEQKYLEKIVKLSHADQVLGLLGQWLYDFEYFPDWYDFYRAVYDRYEDGATVEVVYGAAYGYRIHITKDREEIFAYDYDDYTGDATDDAAKIYEMITKALVQLVFIKVRICNESIFRYVQRTNGY